MYSWLVLLHLLGFAVFLLAHGVSIFIAFRIRSEPNRGVVVALLELSRRAAQVVYLGLALLLVGGIGAAWSAGMLTAPWLVASYVVLVVVLAVMFAIASPYYHGLRGELAGTEATPPLDDVGMALRLRTRRPEVLAATGGIGLTVLVALMTFKPG